MTQVLMVEVCVPMRVWNRWIWPGQGGWLTCKSDHWAETNSYEMSQIPYEKQLAKVNLDHPWGLWDLCDSILTRLGARTHFITPNNFKTERHWKIRSAYLLKFFSNPSFIIPHPMPYWLNIARGQGSPLVTPALYSPYRANIKSETWHIWPSNWSNNAPFYRQEEINWVAPTAWHTTPLGQTEVRMAEWSFAKLDWMTEQ